MSDIEDPEVSVTFRTGGSGTVRKTQQP